MSNKKIALVFVAFFWVICAVAQDLPEPADSSDTEEEKPMPAPPDKLYKLGVKMGMQASRFFGDEVPNATMIVGMNGGFYVRKRFENSRFSLQLESCMSFRGSNFNNGDSGYSKIKTYYLDLPFYIMYSIDEAKTQRPFIGFQTSWLINSSLFYGNSPLPENDEPKLAPMDYLLCGGYQVRAGYVSFQLSLKYGLTNINEGLLSKLIPANSRKNIQNFVVELNLLF